MKSLLAEIGTNTSGTRSSRSGHCTVAVDSEWCKCLCLPTERVPVSCIIFENFGSPFINSSNFKPKLTVAQAVSRRLLTTESRDHIAVVRDLLWTEWHWVRFISEHCIFPVPISIPSMLHIHSHISQVMDSEPIRCYFCPITTMRE